MTQLSHFLAMKSCVCLKSFQKYLFLYFQCEHVIQHVTTTDVQSERAFIRRFDHG